jgi:hypothetical protein
MKDVIKMQEIRRAAMWHTLLNALLMVVVSAAIGAVFYFGLGGV